MYAANHYVSVNGNMYMKDEIISEKMTEEKIGWLLRTKAIREVRPPDKPPESSESCAPEKEKEDPQEAEKEAEAGESKAEEEAEENDGDEPMEIDIDVMAGIVQEDEKEPENPPARAKSRTKGGKRK